MSNVVPNKVDMSLDDIIKISKFEKRKQAHLTQQRNRGSGAQTADRGALRGRGAGATRGRGRGARQTVNPVKQLHVNVQGRQQGRGGGQRGQGQQRGQGRGRGRGINRQNSGISPLNRINLEQHSIQPRGRGGARGRGRAGRVFTNSGFRQQQQPAVTQQQAGQRTDRINKVKQQAALLREKQLAMKNLQQAKKNMQNINMAIQKTSRESVVNQLRGLNNVQTGQARGRGRGRGRKLLAALNRPGSNSLLSIMSSGRQMSDTSVTISNPAALSTDSTQGMNKRRRWRRNPRKQISSEHFTVHVANQNLEILGKQSSVLNQLKLLKPAVTTTYKFQQSVFATPATGISLNDRFSGGSQAIGGDGDGVLADRKVFV